MASDTLTLALWQCPYAASMAEALARLDTTAAEASALGAELLVCPEMSLTGYQIGPDAVARRAEPADGALAQAVAAIAQRQYRHRDPAGTPAQGGAQLRQGGVLGAGDQHLALQAASAANQEFVHVR